MLISLSKQLFSQKMEYMFLNFITVFSIPITIFRDLSNNKLQRLPSDVFNKLTQMDKL